MWDKGSKKLIHLFFETAGGIRGTGATVELTWCMILEVIRVSLIKEAVKEGGLCVSSLATPEANYVPFFFVDESSLLPVECYCVISMGGRIEMT